jgi:hypothetical protein
MNMQKQAFAAIFEPEPNSEYAKQQARSTRVAKVRRPDHANARQAPLPSVRAIDAALERKYGATRYWDPRRAGRRAGTARYSISVG